MPKPSACHSNTAAQRMGGRRLRAAALLTWGFFAVVTRVSSQEPAPKIPDEHPIFFAAISGDSAAVVKYLDSGIPASACSEGGLLVLNCALRGRHLALAREILRRGFQPTMTDQRTAGGDIVEIGFAALSAAAQAAAVDIVDDLLAKGATAFPRLVAETMFEENPVLAAVKLDSTAIFKRILAQGDQVHVRKRILALSHELLAACKAPEAIGILADHGADLDASDSTGAGDRVLHLYAQRDWMEGLAKLLALGADPTKRNRAEKLPEHVAASDKTKRFLMVAALQIRVGRAFQDHSPSEKAAVFPLEPLVHALAESEAAAMPSAEVITASELRAVDDRGWTALNYALHYRMSKLASLFVDRGANVAHITAAGSPIISFAAETGDTALVKKIVAKGARVDAAKNGMPTALIMATQASDTHMIETLLASGASVEPPRPDDRSTTWASALMHAAKTGNIEIIERLKRAGGDIHAVDSSGQNAVFWAVRSGNVDALRWLIREGAYPHLKTPRGTNALTLAASLGKLEMVKALLEIGVIHDDALRYAESSNSQETIEFLRKARKAANPGNPADFWNHHFITLEDVHRYVDSGGDINYAKGCPTPLQAMTSLGNLEAVELLLAKGADPLKLGNLMNLPVFLSMKISGTPDEAKALKLLKAFIEHGVSPNIRSYRPTPEDEGAGTPLLSLAISQGFVACATYLLEKGADPSLRDSLTHEDAFEALQKSHRIDDAKRYELRLLMEQRSKPNAASRTESPPAPPFPARKRNF